MSGVPYLDAAALRAALPPAAAVEVIRGALLGGLTPSTDIPRTSVTLRNGEFLLMPSEAGRSAGIKLLTVAPENPHRGMPRIQGMYLLVDADTLAPRALLDGAALTRIRTAAVSLAPLADTLRRRPSPLEVVVFGAGPQALGHVETVRAVLGSDHDLGPVTTVVRRPDRAEMVVRATAAGSAEATAAVARAGLVICATTARAPLFDSAELRDDAIVIAVGSHEPDARELDSALLGRAQVVVEDVATALREAGDVLRAIEDGALDAASLLPMRDVVRGEARLPADRPVVFKSTGMSWEDLVIAEAVADRTGLGAEHPTGGRSGSRS